MTTSTEHLRQLKAKLQRVRKEQNVQSTQRRRAFFTSAAEEQELVERMYKPNSLARRLMAFLQSSRLQFALTTMLILDVIIVVVELFLDAEFPACSIVARDAISCCGMSNSSCTCGLGGAPWPYKSYKCAAPLVDTYANPATCDPYKHTVVKNIQLIMFSLSVTILALYEVELFCLMAVLRRHFVRNRLYVIDFIVVTAALILEVVVKVNKMKKASSDASSGDLAGVLTFARCWRFVRLGHGLVSSVHEAHAGAMEEMETHVNGLLQHVDVLQSRLLQLEEMALQQAGGKACKKFGKRRVSVAAYDCMKTKVKGVMQACGASSPGAPTGGATGGAATGSSSSPAPAPVRV